ncbi:alpha/beta fold hydrolase [Streptomyces sp. NPDC007088]|uniref:alpha/beta fold hydrolase n=1 Tax=Streptomyces sp. NPDC007088 TaxID=3364773 RepID=UPI0036BCCE49
MPYYAAADGTRLAYRETGTGPPLICLPGGPMRAGEYLGDLGGLNAHHRLLVPDLRGTGASAVPQDPASYRCDRLAEDIEALRRHLGLDTADLLAHSAGANLAVRYLQAYGGRVDALVLVTPSPLAVGLHVTARERAAAVRPRRTRPWYPQAVAALGRIVAGEASEADWDAAGPLYYQRWDETARAHWEAEERQTNERAAEVFVSEGAFDPPAARAVLAARTAPSLVLAGETDPGGGPALADAYTALLPRARPAETVVQRGAGHYPWLDDPDGFVSAVAGFLARAAAEAARPRPGTSTPHAFVPTRPEE